MAEHTSQDRREFLEVAYAEAGLTSGYAIVDHHEH